jgi:hypothetical protein
VDIAGAGEVETTAEVFTGKSLQGGSRGCKERTDYQTDRQSLLYVHKNPTYKKLPLAFKKLIQAHINI